MMGGMADKTKGGLDLRSRVNSPESIEHIGAFIEKIRAIASKHACASWSSTALQRRALARLVTNRLLLTT